MSDIFDTIQSDTQDIFDTISVEPSVQEQQPEAEIRLPTFREKLQTLTGSYQRELQREVGAGGVPGPREVMDTAFKFATPPPPVSERIEKYTDIPLKVLPPAVAGGVQGIRDIALQVPFAAGAVGLGKTLGRGLLAMFTGEFLYSTPEIYQQYQAARAKGDDQLASRILIGGLGTAALLGAGAKIDQNIRAGGRTSAARQKLANDILDLSRNHPEILEAAKPLIQRPAPESQRVVPPVQAVPVVAPPKPEDTVITPTDAITLPTATAEALKTAGAKPAEAGATMQAGVAQAMQAGRAAPPLAAEAATQRAGAITKPAWVINLEAVEKAGNLNEGQAERLNKWRAANPSAPAVPVVQAKPEPSVKTAKAVETSTAETAGAIKPFDVRVEGVGQDAEIASNNVRSMNRTDHVYRGMTESEFDNTISKGTGVESRKDFSFGSEGTSFSERAEDAESYINFGRDDPRTTGKPTYIVEVKQSPNLIKNRQGYYEAKSMVPMSDVSRAWKIDAQGNKLVARLVMQSELQATPKPSNVVQPASQQPAAPAAQPVTGGPSAISQGPEQKSNQPKYQGTDVERQATGPSRSDQPQGSRTEPQAEQGQKEGSLLLNRPVNVEEAIPKKHWAIVKDGRVVTSGNRVDMTMTKLGQLAEQYNGTVIFGDTSFSKQAEVGNILGMTWQQIQDRQQGRRIQQPTAPTPPTAPAAAQAAPAPTAGQVGQPGPGAQTVGEPPYSAAKQLIDLMKAREPQGVKESISWRTKLADKWAAGKGALANAVARSRAITETLKETQRGVRTPTDMDRRIGSLDWALQQSMGHSKTIGKTIVERHKNKAEREAVALWIDAGGNEALIRETLATLPRNMASNIRRALEIAGNLPQRLRPFVEEIRQYYSIREQDAVTHKIFEHGLADYYTHVWKRSENMPDSLRSAISNGRVSTYFRNARERKIPTFLEGISQGKVPMLDPAAVLPQYNYSLDRAIASRQFIADISGLTTAEGEPIFKPAGRTSRVPGEDETQTIFIDSNAFNKNHENYRAIDHPALTKWNWKTTTPEGTVVFAKDNLLVHKDFYERLARFMDRGRLSSGPLLSGMLRLSTEVKGFKLGLLSPFHQVHVGTHSLFHWTRPGLFKAEPIDWDAPATRFAVEKGHLKLAPNPHELTMFSEGQMAQGWAQKIPLIGEWSRLYSTWLFGEYIPGLKLKTFGNALERNMKYYAGDIRAGKITAEEVAARVGDSVNNAYGELNHLFLGKNGRNPVLQKFLRLVFLAPDFGEARLRFTEKAFTKYGMEERLAFATMITTLYMAARVGNWLSHGDPEMDLKNAFKVKVGDQWVTMRSVAGDIVHALTGFTHFLYIRTNPVWSRTMMDMALGRDFTGRKLDAYQKFVKRPIEQFIPIQMTALTRDDAKLWQSMATAFGVQIIPDKPMQDVSRLVRKWMVDQDDPLIREKLEQREQAIFPPSPYIKLRVALRDGKRDAAREIFKDLLRSGRKPEDIEQSFRPHHTTEAGFQDIKPMAGLTETEWLKFLKDITPAQRKMVKAAVRERYKTWTNYQRFIGAIKP